MKFKKLKQINRFILNTKNAILKVLNIAYFQHKTSIHVKIQIVLEIKKKEKERGVSSQWKCGA